MIGIRRHVRVYAFGAPVDLRKGFGGLSALVRQSLRRDPLSGDLFLFANKKRRSAKVLHWDGTGLCVYAKRLEKGRFASLWRDAGRSEMALTVTELELFLEGSDLVGRCVLSPPPIEESDLFARRRTPERATRHATDRADSRS